jgi:transcriptional regulator with XRE-family HTH domain
MTSTFAERLKEARTAKKMSLQDLANKTGLAKYHLYCFEHGKYEPRMITLVWLAEALGVSMDWLAGRNI